MNLLMWNGAQYFRSFKYIEGNSTYQTKQIYKPLFIHPPPVRDLTALIWDLDTGPGEATKKRMKDMGRSPEKQ